MTAEAVRQRLDRFADDLASRLPGMFVVERTHSLAVTLRPVCTDALPVTWFDDGDSLQVEALAGPGGYAGLAGRLPRPRWRQRGKVAKYASYSG